MSHRSAVSVSASIVNADLLHLEHDLERLLAAGVDSVHVDLEDGVFVPEFNLGAKVAEAAVRWGKLPVDVHLMVSDPEGIMAMLAPLRLRTVAVHYESTRYPRRVLALAKQHGWRAAIAFNPATRPPDLAQLAPHLDEVLVLTTEPEAGGAPFIEAALPVIAATANRARVLGVPVVVDGGVSVQNVDAIAEAGADSVVVGRALFSAPDLPALVRRISKGTP